VLPSHKMSTATNPDELFHRRARVLKPHVMSALGAMRIFDPPGPVQSRAAVGQQLLIPELYDDDFRLQKEIARVLASMSAQWIIMHIQGFGGDPTRGFSIQDFEVIEDEVKRANPAMAPYRYFSALKWEGETPLDMQAPVPQNLVIVNPELATREEMLRRALENPGDGHDYTG